MQLPDGSRCFGYRDEKPGTAVFSGASARTPARARRRIVSSRRPNSGPLLGRCRGFSLLEVLLTVFIVGVGLLGLGQLSVISTQASRDAFFRSQADVLAYDMIDRMRANRLVALAGNYDLAYADADPGGGTVQDIDRADWRTLLRQALPQAQGQISRAGNVLTVGVRWFDSMDGNTMTITVSSEL